MTEAQWLDCDYPKPMLAFLKENGSDRKMRLFGVACCRLVWELLATNECRRTVELAERAADDPTIETELLAACRAVLDQGRDARGFSPPGSSRRGAAINAAFFASTSKMWHVQSLAEAVQTLAARSGTAAHQCRLLRDIFGNPCHPVTFDASWRTLSVVSLAQTMYDNRTFDRMPELGDALERAGCRDQAILDHCRKPGEHVRGCWVVDLVLGNQ